MRSLTGANYQRARDFVMTRARPVDRALFSYAFEQGKPEVVWDALGEFANSDGGYGHGIEPDCRLPASSTLGTITAFPYLVQTRAPAEHPLVANGINYLLDTYDKRLKGWRILPPEANNHPRAGWWNYDPAKADADVVERWINPSACAVADLHHYAALVPDDFLLEITNKAMTELEAKRATMEGQDFLAFIELAEALPAKMANSVWEQLKPRARAAIVTDPAQWIGYGIRPLWAVSGPTSPLMSELKDAVSAQLDFELERQDADGSWHPFWTWGRFEQDWQNARVEWQGQLTVKLLRSLKSFGRIA